MLTNLPQFQDLKAKYSAHLSIAQECMSFFERHKLNSVGNLEQVKYIKQALLWI